MSEKPAREGLSQKGYVMKRLKLVALVAALFALPMLFGVTGSVSADEGCGCGESCECVDGCSCASACDCGDYCECEDECACESECACDDGCECDRCNDAE